MATRKGFTLIELLVVLAILAIAAALMVPNLRGYVQRLQLGNATEEFSGLLKAVRERSVTTSQGHRINLAAGQTSLSWQIDSTGATTRGFRLPYGQVGTFSDTDGQINFTGRGLPDRQYVITLSHGSLTRRVVLLPTGKVVLP